MQPGMTALIRPSATPDKVLAQFDAFHAQRAGQDLAWDWHEFNATDFEVNE
jgi:hypothetical protein